MSNDVLDAFIQKKSKFFDLPDGASKVAKYIKAELVTTNFQGKLIESIRYHFEVDGQILLWDRTSRSLAIQMSEFVSGDVLELRRIGQKNQTRYQIKRMNDEG